MKSEPYICVKIPVKPLYKVDIEISYKNPDMTRKMIHLPDTITQTDSQYQP